MDRIIVALRASKYSIHDLSRSQGEGDANLARFNMPLELGIAMAEATARRKSTDRHDWLLLVPQNHPYRQFISDLAGYDPSPYDGTPSSVVPPVMAWMATRPDAVECAAPRQVLPSLAKFGSALVELREKWHDHAPWTHVVVEAQKVAREAGLIPTAAE